MAYTQGNQVYVAPGQDKHLGHELGHVVQQKQGRVAPTQRLNKLSINNDLMLEKEADEYAAGTKQHIASAETNNSLSNNVIQCKIGFEFQTNLKMKTIDDKDPPFRTTLHVQNDWRIVCDQGDLEFVTSPFDDAAQLLACIKEISDFADRISAQAPLDLDAIGELGATTKYNTGSILRLIDSYIGELENANEKDKPDIIKEIEKSKLDLLNMEVRPLPSLSKDSKQYFAVGPKQITASPQATIGVPLEELGSVLENAEDKGHKVIYKDSLSMPLKNLVAQTRAVIGVKPDEISELEWNKIIGILSLAASYADIGIKQSNTQYIKSYISMMSRVNFAAMYKELAEAVRPLFIPDTIAKIIGIGVGNTMFMYKKSGSSTKLAGPSIDKWIKGIISGNDLFATDELAELERQLQRLLGTEETHGGDEFSGMLSGSESMGAMGELDKDKAGTRNLAPIEFRALPKGLSYQLWSELALDIVKNYGHLL